MTLTLTLTNMLAKSALNDFITVYWHPTSLAIPFALHATLDPGAAWSKAYYPEFDATLYKVVTDDSNLVYTNAITTDTEASFIQIRQIELSRQNLRTTLYKN